MAALLSDVRQQLSVTLLQWSKPGHLLLDRPHSNDASAAKRKERRTGHDQQLTSTNMFLHLYIKGLYLLML